MKKLLSLILCITIALFAVACNPSGDNGGVTEDGKVIIKIPIGWGGGGGQDGIRKLGEMFSADPEFGGKARGKYTGAVIKVVEGEIPTTASGLAGTGLDVLGFSHGAPLVSTLANGIVCLDDLMQKTYPGESKTLDQKIPENYKKYFQSNGSYYAMPFDEMYCGMAMYTELWERDQLYIAAAHVDGQEFDATPWAGYHSWHSNTFGVTLYFSDYDGEPDSNLCIGYESGDNSTCLRSGQFTGNSDYVKRSVGPDGLPDTLDDGQPSTVVEFLALCEYLNSGAVKQDPRAKQGRGNTKMTYYDAITFSGTYKTSYDALFLDGFFASLAGQDYQSILTLDSEGEEIEVVTGFSSEPLFPGLPASLQHIKKPITQKVVVTPSCGYYTSWMVEKYYTDAVFEILIKGTNDNGSYFHYGNAFSNSNIEAQYDFLIGNYMNNVKQEACAYMLDGSYVNAEMRANGKLRQVYNNYDQAIDIRMQYASLPVNFDEPVVYDEITETHNGDQPSLVVIGKDFQVISKRVERDPDKLAYCLDWLLYTRSDVSMAIHYMYKSNPCIMAGNMLDIIDNNPTSGLATHELYNYYNKKLLELHASARIFRPIGGDEINPFNNAGYYKRGFGSGIFYPEATKNAYNYLLSNGAKATFIEQAYTKDTWSGMYKGNITGNVNKTW